ncbi:PH domain-containing protein [Aquibium microcysteis]|uniref:PH domain-containing protein n=1 Tax=Aquibium microcysteis TaxID=675281 RepID=UPI00165D2894|nr:PH domain-containing protein [Aquibium microcysteis]
MRGDNDNPDVGAEGSFLPSARAVFLPTVVIVIGYAVVLAVLWFFGRGDGALARLCLVVLAVGGPFLIAHAILRRFTVRIDVMPHAVYAHTGFPRKAPDEIPYALIRRLTLRQGPVGRLTDSGTLLFEISGGTSIMVADLARPHHALRVIGRLIEDAAVGFVPAAALAEPEDQRSILQR